MTFLKKQGRREKMSKTTWKIKGELLLDPQLEDIRNKYGTRAPLSDVPVKVSAREKIVGAWGPWNKWQETTTGSNGKFSIEKEKDKSDRQFKVEVLFKDDTLKLYPENDGVLATLLDKFTGWNPITDFAEAALEQVLEQTTRLAYDVKWFTVYKEDKKDNKHKHGTVDLGKMIFGKNRSEDRGLRVARCHAEIWLLVKEVFKYMRGLEGDVAFIKDAKTIAIKYPHSNPLIGDKIEASYANPENYTAHIIKNSRSDDFDVQTLIHELLHLYVYQRSTREKGLAWQLFIHGSTHDGHQKKTWVPFNEAIAEWSSNFIFECLFNRKASIYGGEDALALPFSRSYLRHLGANTLSDVDHYEDGWMSLFNNLLAGSLSRYDLNAGYDPKAFDPDPYVQGTASPMPAAKLKGKFASILKVFLPKKGSRYDGWLKRKEMNLNDFLDRMVAVWDDFSTTDKNIVKGVLNPVEPRQFSDLGKPLPKSGPQKDPKEPPLQAGDRAGGKRTGSAQREEVNEPKNARRGSKANRRASGGRRRPAAGRTAGKRSRMVQPTGN